MKLRRGASGLNLALLLALAGCGGKDSVERVPVSGTVTFQGQPVQDGQIRFVPDAETATGVVIEAIENERYATKSSGGLTPGKYRVEILAFDPQTPPPQTAEDPPRKQLIPDKYNQRTQLRLTVEPGQKATAQNYAL